MTLLVTECSRLGIVMLADTQGTYADGRGVSGIGKIVYHAGLNVALGGWGEAAIGRQRLDNWLRAFLVDVEGTALGVQQLGEHLVARANKELAASGRPWAGMKRRGVHIAGFDGGTAVLYHAHMGPDAGPIGPLELEKTSGVPEAHGRALAQLRNGIWPTFIEHWDRDVKLSGWGDMSSIEGRLSHYEPIFRSVAFESAAIDDQISGIALTVEGPKVNKLVVASPSEDAMPEWTEPNGALAF